MKLGACAWVGEFAEMFNSLSRLFLKKTIEYGFCFGKSISNTT